MNTDSQIQNIIDRNNRVEADKAWEVSLTRRLCIAVITYLTASLFLWIINVEGFWINALVPVGGYLLSTLSLGWLKSWWLQKHYKQ